MIKTKIAQIAISVFMIILVISSYFLIRDFLEHKKSNDSSIELIENVITEEKTEKDIEIDWEKLKNINEDIIGWIKIDNTNINYPILKDTDNLKYLKHSFDGKYNNNGSIFTLNNNPFQDYETVLYGHNMKSGIMFSELGKYMNKEFFDKHSSFEIYTKNQNYKATVFSCYSIGINKEENNIKLLDFEEQVEYYKKASKYGSIQRKSVSVSGPKRFFFIKDVYSFLFDIQCILAFLHCRLTEWFSFRNPGICPLLQHVQKQTCSYHKHISFSYTSIPILCSHSFFSSTVGAANISLAFSVSCVNAIGYICRISFGSSSGILSTFNLYLSADSFPNSVISKA